MIFFIMFFFIIYIIHVITLRTFFYIAATVAEVGGEFLWGVVLEAVLALLLI